MVVIVCLPIVAVCGILAVLIEKKLAVAYREAKEVKEFLLDRDFEYHDDSD